MSAPLFHAEAADELRAAVLWYGERSPRAASEFIGELDDALGKIQGAWALEARPRPVAALRSPPLPFPDHLPRNLAWDRSRRYCAWTPPARVLAIPDLINPAASQPPFYLHAL